MPFLSMRSTAETLARNNPFAAHRVESLAFLFVDGDWPAQFGRLRALGFRGSIVGPEGSGKTTLLHELVERLGGVGLNAALVRAPVRAADNSNWLERWLDDLKPSAILLIDSAERMSRTEWRQVLMRDSGGVVATMHRPGRLPTWIRCRPDWNLAQRLLLDLGFEDADHHFWSTAQAVFRRHRGNIRCLFRELYDDCARGR